MKGFVKLLTVFMLVSVGAVMLSGMSSAQGKLELKLENKEQGISLEWNGSKKKTYCVYKRSGKGKFTVIGQIKGKKYTDKNVKSGQSYTYCVKLKENKSVKSDRETKTYLAPPTMKKSAVSDGGVTVRWNSTEGAQAYNIYRKKDGGKAKKLGRTEKSSFRDTTAVKGVAYTYTVKAVKGKTVSAGAKVKAGILNAPKLVSLKKSTEGLVLKWKKNSEAESYLVYRKAGESGKWKKLKKLSAAELSYEDKTARDGERYSYFVKAVSGDSVSLYEGKSLNGLCIKAPEKFSLKKDGKKIKLKWNKKSGAVKYEVYKKTNDGKWKKLKETKKTSYTDKIKSTKDFLSYKVRAVMKSDKSAFSSVVSNRDTDPTKPMVALTYDDGPHPVNTHRILDTLEKHGARATFFVVGSRITEYPDCLERQAELGCEIGNHSFSHVTLSVSSDKTVREEIEKTDKLIEKYSGQTPSLCRAPGGSVGKAAKLLDRPFIHWSVDTLDWQSRSSSKVVSNIKQNVRDGSIILMHDLYGSTADASEIIIPWLISEGYQLVTVSELLQARKGGAEGGKIYYNGYA